LHLSFAVVPGDGGDTAAASSGIPARASLRCGRRAVVDVLMWPVSTLAREATGDADVGAASMLGERPVRRRGGLGVDLDGPDSRRRPSCSPFARARSFVVVLRSRGAVPLAAQQHWRDLSHPRGGASAPSSFLKSCPDVPIEAGACFRRARARGPGAPIESVVIAFSEVPGWLRHPCLIAGAAERIEAPKSGLEPA